jgi:hypothetical protein
LDANERDTMRALSACAHEPEMHRFLQGAGHALRQVLAENKEMKSTQTSIPLNLFRLPLPPDVRSSWVFVLRENHAYEAERHPNSTQRMFALDGRGAMEVWEKTCWRRHDFEANAADPGLSIPTHTWHRPVRLPRMWAVVSFHTVVATDLVEELGDPSQGGVFASRHYQTTAAS